MGQYKTKAKTIKGTSYQEIVKSARRAYGDVRAKSRRSPYVRSKYFGGNKVFLNLFWEHISQKRRGERIKRLAFYECALELIAETRLAPVTAIKNRDTTISYHRFDGITREGLEFIVQLKESKKTGRIDFMSVFPKK
jgi:hypothetical protein